MTPEETRRHIEHKARLGELKPEVAQRMLAALDADESADYQVLLEQATFLPPPPFCYHTAPATARGDIASVGLRVGDGRNWVDGQMAGQPPGVYVGPEPDLRGIWSHRDAEWDVWRVDMAGLPWVHDRLNPGCWAITMHVPPDMIALAHVVASHKVDLSYPSAT